MISPAIGALTAVWLMLSPALDLEAGPRAYLVIAAGVTAFVLSPLTIWSRPARGALAAVGLAIALINFVLPCSIEALACLATAGAALIVAGLAPSPVVARYASAVAAIGAPSVVARQDDEITAPSRGVRSAA